MLRYMSVLCLFALVVCSFAKPKAVVHQDPQITVDDLYGEWIWLKTHCCGRIMNVTVDTAQTPTIISFTQDGKQLTYKGKQVARTKTYEFYIDPNLGSPALKLEGVSAPALVHINGDTLVLDYGYMDLQTEFYVRPRR